VPLSGIRIVDLTRILGRAVLHDDPRRHGAEVIKVETPGVGDPLRGQGVIKDGLSWYFAAFNRNKRSLSLNLREPEGKAVLARLIAQSDVLVEKLPPGGHGADGLRRTALASPQARSRLRQHQRLRQNRALSRPAVLRFHRPGDERVHGGDRRGPGAALARRAADRRPRRRALRRDRGVRRAGQARSGPAPARRSVRASTMASSASSGFSPPIIWRPARSRDAPATTMRSSRPMACSARRTARSRWRHRRSNPISA